MEESKIEDIGELDTVIAELEISKGKGNIILCVVNSPLYRDKIIKTLNGRFSSKIINVNNGEQIISILKNKDFDSAEILIWTMPEEATEDLINTLNNFRELFYETKIPSVIFYNLGFSEQVITKAPDFWRYRGNYYEFKEEGMGLAFDAMEVLSTSFTYKDKEDLLRRKRINEYLLENVRDKKEKFSLLNEQGIIFYNFGGLDKALEYFENALELSEELSEELELKEGIAHTLGNMGNVYQIQGDMKKAIELFEKAQEIFEEIGDKRGMANQLGNTGNVYRMQGELKKAIELFEKSLEIFEEIGDKRGMASDLGNMGIVYRMQGDMEKALERHEKALEFFKVIGNKPDQAQTLINIGFIFIKKGDKSTALNYYLEAQEIAQDYVPQLLKEINKVVNRLLAMQ